MALRLLPFRQYNEHDVINMFALDDRRVNDNVTGVGYGDAGVFVKVSTGNFNADPISYDTNSYLGKTDYPFVGYVKYPSVALKVEVASSGDIPLGITLNQTAKYDENGESLLRYPQKKLELQAVCPGQAVPIATRGIFVLSSNAFEGTASLYSVASGIKMSNNTSGKVTGAALTDSACFGRVLGTGSRTNLGPTTDQFSGEFLVVKLGM